MVNESRDGSSHELGSAPDPVQRALDERIRQEALRQLESFEPDPHDDDWRIDPLPRFEPTSDSDEPSPSGESEDPRQAEAEPVDRRR